MPGGLYSDESLKQTTKFKPRTDFDEPTSMGNAFRSGVPYKMSGRGFEADPDDETGAQKRMKALNGLTGD